MAVRQNGITFAVLCAAVSAFAGYAVSGLLPKGMPPEAIFLCIPAAVMWAGVAGFVFPPLTSVVSAGVPQVYFHRRNLAGILGCALVFESFLAHGFLSAWPMSAESVFVLVFVVLGLALIARATKKA